MPRVPSKYFSRLAENKTSRQIAAGLNCGLETAQNHRFNICAKLHI